MFVFGQGFPLLLRPGRGTLVKYVFLLRGSPPSATWKGNFYKRLVFDEGFPSFCDPEGTLLYKCFLGDTTTCLNGTAMTRHRLILCQHGATACTDLLEAYLAQYPAILSHFLLNMFDLLVSGVLGVKKYGKGAG